MARALAPGGTVTDETLARLETLTGHSFADRARLDRALTHASARSRTGTDYERLEFLGDRVLGLCIAEMLFSKFENANEGELSVRLNALVNADALAEVADELSLHEFIRIGADVADISAARQKNMRADVVEALIATIYLDGGLNAVRPFVNRYWSKRAAESDAARRDAKTELQEWAHRVHQLTPSYHVISRDGPDHEPVFTVSVEIGSALTATATGSSKRHAEQAAATIALVEAGVWQNETSNNQ